MNVISAVRRLSLPTSIALAAVLCIASPSGAEPGDLTDAGCIQDAGGTDCIATADGLNGAVSVVVSPDGTSAYTVSSVSDSIVTFVRDPDGALTDDGCIQNTGGTDCLGSGGTFRGLNGPSDVAISPDGQNVYVASADGNALVVFTRAGDGTLTPTACLRDSASSSYCDGMGVATEGLRSASAVVVSPDGQNVYVASILSDAVAVFDRAENGSLTQAGCIQNTGRTECMSIGGTTPGLDGAYDVAISPDGLSVYVVANLSDSIVVFDRAEDGSLTPAGCIQDTGGSSCDGSGGTTAGLNGPRAVSVSPDGTTVYVASHLDDAVLRFARAEDGELTASGCVQDAGGTDCNGVGGNATGLNGSSAVAVSPDGQSLYVASITSDAVVVFDRAMDGSLTSAGCIQDTGLTDCTNDGGSTVAGLNGAIDATLSPDGSTVYIASTTSDAVVVFEREVPPTTTTTTLFPPTTTTTLPPTTTTTLPPTTTTTLPPTTTTLPPTTTTTLPPTTTTLPPTTTTLPPTTTTLPPTTTTLPPTTTTLPPTTTTLPPPTTTTLPPPTTTTLPPTTTTLPPPTTTTLPPTTTTLPPTTTTLPPTTTTLPPTTTTTMMVTTTTLPPPACGDANRSGTVTSVDALAILNAAVGGPECDEFPCACDVAGGGTVLASDAQRALRIAVGIPDAALCNC